MWQFDVYPLLSLLNCSKQLCKATNSIFTISITSIHLRLASSNAHYI